MGSPQANYSDQLQQGPQNKFIFSEEEARVLRECRTESFWSRSVPLSVGAMFATRALISRGYLTTSPKYGSIPKIVFAGFFGYMIGKASYINTCKEKLMALEGSRLAELLREEKNSKVPGFRPPPSKPIYPEQGASASLPPDRSSAPPEPQPRSSGYSTQYDNSAAEVPFSSTMSESATTGITDNLAREPELQDQERAKPLPPPPPPVTYEELRRKNRGVYDVLAPQTPERPAPPRAPTKEAKKNKYGDAWED
ncbi:OCIA domain-containing protein 1 [Hyperolius riggenbachi]|uniref:OCIA domain-containing protein 1 n=1 Tax=Hyperolius riggenbachi TaxID=752182 RepID=UPI0035A3AB7C